MSEDKPSKPEADNFPEPVVEQEPEITKSTSMIERRLVTILSADVAGYSKLMAEHEEHTLKVFRQHKKVFEQIIELHRGRIFNTAGDAILAEFSSAVEGVRCATEIQSALATKNDQIAEGKKVLFRIGVNLGDVIVQGDDLMGDGVNLAARVQTSAEPGGVCISGAIWDQVQNKLSLNVNPLGEVNYKNIPNPVRTFSVHIEKGNGRGYIPSGQAQVQRSRFQGTAFLVASAATFLVASATLYFIVKGRNHEGAPATYVVNYSAGSNPAGGQNAQAQLPGELKNDAVAAAKTVEAAMSQKIGDSASPAAPYQFFRLPVHNFQRAWVKPVSKGLAKWLVAPGQSSGNARPTIQEAVAAAAAGDVIEVRAGVYKESLSIEKDVTLRGLPGEDGKVAVTVEWQGLETAHLIDGKVTIENMNFVVVSSDVVKPAFALLVNGSHARLNNVGAFATGVTGTSAFSLRAGEAVVENSEFRGVRAIDQMGGKLECNGCKAADAAEEGIVAFNQANDPGFRSVFRKSQVTGSGTSGVTVMAQTTASFEDCEVSGSVVNGVQLLGTAKVKFTGGEIMGNKENGFVVADQGQAEVRNVKSSQNGFSGFATTLNGVLELKDSESVSNGEYGFAALNDSKVKESGNRFVGNRAGPGWRAPASTAAPVPAK